MIKIKILGDNKIELDGTDITSSVTDVEIKWSYKFVSEVKLTLFAEVDIETEANLLSLEKDQHVRINTLDNPRSRFVRVK